MQPPQLEGYSAVWRIQLGIQLIIVKSVNHGYLMKPRSLMQTSLLLGSESKKPRRYAPNACEALPSNTIAGPESARVFDLEVWYMIYIQSLPLSYSPLKWDGVCCNYGRLGRTRKPLKTAFNWSIGQMAQGLFGTRIRTPDNRNPTFPMARGRVWFLISSVHYREVSGVFSLLPSKCHWHGMGWAAPTLGKWLLVIYL